MSKKKQKRKFIRCVIKDDTLTVKEKIDFIMNAKNIMKQRKKTGLSFYWLK